MIIPPADDHAGGSGTEKGWLRRQGIVPRKRLGQNFLIHAGTASRLVRAMAITSGGSVLEIGAGAGALTRALLDSGHTVLAVEVDPRLVALLQARFESEIGSGRLRLHAGSILDLERPIFPDSAGSRPFLAGNLPYAITTPILLWMIERKDLFERAAVLMQREVAARIVSPPGSRTYGSLTVWLAFHAKARNLATVGPGSFWPVPEVDSTLVGFDFHREPPVAIGSPEHLERILSATFGQRRKMLRASLGNALDDPERTIRLLDQAGIDGRRRPESLTLAEFAVLADAIGGFLP
jgi:16S rRNA (adenine1518-N6/adenine1519-N6)-dimethyltransferase